MAVVIMDPETLAEPEATALAEPEAALPRAALPEAAEGARVPEPLASAGNNVNTNEHPDTRRTTARLTWGGGRLGCTWSNSALRCRLGGSRCGSTGSTASFLTTHYECSTVKTLLQRRVCVHTCSSGASEGNILMAALLQAFSHSLDKTW